MAIDSSRVPVPVKRIAHLGSRSYGRLTAPARMLPSFLICGGQRCGTTSLYRALAAHPVVLKAVLHKGVHYFDLAYHRGLGWYRGHFPLLRAAARVEREYGAPAQTFESSPYYMYHPLAMGRIVRDLPGVRVVVLVRDPVERAYSQHAHEVEPARLRGQEERLRRDASYYSFSHQHHAYRGRGEYARHLERMAALLGRDRIKVVCSERFFADPAPVYDEVLDFLGLPRLGHPPFLRHNARSRPAPMHPDLRADLTAHFAPFNERLADWLGHPPPWPHP
jgi:hypothetical protein